jgi:hypothetical protein
LIVGARPDGRNPAIRRLLADGLFRHIEILRGRPELIDPRGFWTFVVSLPGRTLASSPRCDGRPPTTR